MKIRTVMAAALLATAGCAGPPLVRRDPDAPPPSEEERVHEILGVANRQPSRWSPAITIPLAPLLLVVNTVLQIGNGAVEFIKHFPERSPYESDPLPEWVLREEHYFWPR